MKSSVRYTFLLILVCAAIFFVNPEAIYINIMEARNFITAREMITEGNWIFTTMNALPRYEKPPLPTWLTALSMWSFGRESLAALRLPPALMALMLVLVFFRFMKKITNHSNFAFIAALILSTSFYIIFSGRDGQWDIFTHSFMLVGIYFLYLLFNSRSNFYGYAILSGLFFGFSFLSKGPVSMYALLLPFLISYGLIYKFKDLRPRLAPLGLMMLIFLLVGGWWNLYVYLNDQEALAAITKQETGRWLNYNVRPIYYYWSFVVQSGIWTIPAFVSLLYPYLKDKVFDKKAYSFTLLWTLTAVVLLSLIPEKKSRYLMPVLIPLAATTGFYIEYLFQSFKEKAGKKEFLVVFFNFGLIALIACAFPVAGYIYWGNSVGEFIFWYASTSIILFSIGVAIFYFLSQKQIRSVFYLNIGFIITLTCFGLPMANELFVNPDYRSIRELKSMVETQDTEVYEFQSFTPELGWEYGEVLPAIYDGSRYSIPKKKKFLMLATAEEEPALRELFKEHKVEKIDYLDMNPVATKHKPRLYRDLYLITTER